MFTCNSSFKNLKGKMTECKWASADGICSAVSESSWGSHSAQHAVAVPRTSTGAVSESDQKSKPESNPLPMTWCWPSQGISLVLLLLFFMCVTMPSQSCEDFIKKYSQKCFLWFYIHDRTYWLKAPTDPTPKLSHTPGSILRELSCQPHRHSDRHYFFPYV